MPQGVRSSAVGWSGLGGNHSSTTLQQSRAANARQTHASRVRLGLQRADSMQRQKMEERVEGGWEGDADMRDAVEGDATVVGRGGLGWTAQQQSRGWSWGLELELELEHEEGQLRGRIDG